jgi:hypothetical protein
MGLDAKTYPILSVLNDIKDAFLTLLQKPNKQPALLMMYAFIDICASLGRSPGERSNQRIFVSYLEAFATPGMQRAIPPKQVWAARSALLHTFSPLGHHTGPGKEKPIFYYAWDEKKEDVRRALEERGYTDFVLLSVNDIKTIAIWTFNGFIMRVESDAQFRLCVLENAEHLLLDYRSTQVKQFFEYMESLEQQSQDDAQ